MIDLGRQQAGHGAETFAAVEGLLTCRGYGPANRQTYTSFGRSLRVAGVGDHFQGGDAQVDSLRGELN